MIGGNLTRNEGFVQESFPLRRYSKFHFRFTAVVGNRAEWVKNVCGITSFLPWTITFWLIFFQFTTWCLGPGITGIHQEMKTFRKNQEIIRESVPKRENLFSNQYSKFVFKICGNFKHLLLPKFMLSHLSRLYWPLSDVFESSNHSIDQIIWRSGALLEFTLNVR